MTTLKQIKEFLNEAHTKYDSESEWDKQLPQGHIKSKTTTPSGTFTNATHNGSVVGQFNHTKGSGTIFDLTPKKTKSTKDQGQPWEHYGNSNKYHGD